MKTPWDVIAELESDNSRLVKESIVLQEAVSGNTEFFRGAKVALDSMVTFGIKKVEPKKGNGRGLKPETF